MNFVTMAQALSLIALC